MTPSTCAGRGLTAHRKTTHGLRLPAEVDASATRCRRTHGWLTPAMSPSTTLATNSSSSGTGHPPRHRRQPPDRGSAGAAHLYFRQHRRAEGRHVPAAQSAKMWSGRPAHWAGSSAAGDHAELHADEPRHGPRRPVRHAERRWHSLFRRQTDLSTLFEDLALARPTELNLVPRVWDMLFGDYQARSTGAR